MKKRSKVLMAAILLLIIAGLGAGLLFLRSERFQELARAAVVSRLEQATGLSCTITRLRINVFRGAFHIYGLSIHQPSGAGAPLQCSVDEVSGSLRLKALLQVRLNLAELKVVRPHVVLTLGQSENGWDPEEFLRGFRKSLDLAAGLIEIRDGWIEANNRRVPLDFSLKDLVCEIQYRAAPEGYRIHLAYKSAQLILGDDAITYDLETRAEVALEGIGIKSLDFRYGKSRLSAEGWVREWKSPVLLLHSTGTVAASDLAIFDRNLRDASGNISVQADFKLDAAGFHSTAGFSLASGKFRGVAVEGVKGLMEFEGGVLSLNDVRGRLGTGDFVAAATFYLRPGDPTRNRLNIRCRAITLKHPAAMLNLPAIEYDNMVDGQVRVSWKGGNQSLDVSGDLQLLERLDSTLSAGRSTEFGGKISFNVSKGTWYIPSASLRSSHSEVTVAGGGSPIFRLQLKTSQISELLNVLRRFSITLDDALSRHPDLIGITGSYELDGDVRVEEHGEVSYRGQVRAKDGQWRSYAMETLNTQASWAGQELNLQSLTAQRGPASVTGNLRIIIPAEETQPPDYSFQGNIRQVPLALLKEFGLDYGADVTGTLSGSGSISVAAGVWKGDGQLLIEKGSYKGESFDSLRGQVRLGSNLLRILDCRLIRGAAQLSGRGEINLDSGEMDLNTRLAEFSLRALPSVQERELEVDGQVSAAGRVSGTFENPAFHGNLELDGLRYSTWDLGKGTGTVELKDRILEGDASVQSGFGSFKFHASISSESGFPGKAQVELRDWNLQKLVSGDLPPFLSDLSTALQGRIEIEGSFANPSSLNYRGEIDGARLKIRDYELRNAGKVRFTVLSQRLHMDGASIVGDGTQLALRGEVPLDNSANLDLLLDGNLNLKMLEHMEKNLQLAGSARLSVSATGSLRNPQVIGQATLSNTRLDYSDLPFHVSSMQGSIIFSRNLVRLENLQGAAASGTVQVTGALEHQNAEIRGVNLQVSARGARLPYPKDFRSTVDADLILRGGLDSQILTGEIRVIRSEYLRDFNLLEQIASRSPSAPGPQTTVPFLAGLRLNVAIVSEEGLYIDNELTKLRGGMRLALRGTPAYPSLIGRVVATEGSIFFRGNRFEIIRAAADFVDRNRINPVLEVRAEADVRTYRMLLDVNGDLDHLRFNVTSDPPLSTVDILTLLTTGKEREPGVESSRRQAEITGLSAASILSESLTGVLGKRVQRIFGLESFRVDPFLAGVENDPTARVTISERLSKDLSITFSRNLSTNEEQVVIVEYEVSKNLSVVATRNENGQFGLDFRFHKRFR